MQHVGPYLPEPDDLFAVPSVVTIHRVPLPVLQVYLLHAAQHHLYPTHIPTCKQNSGDTLIAEPNSHNRREKTILCAFLNQG